MGAESRWVAMDGGYGGVGVAGFFFLSRGGGGVRLTLRVGGTLGGPGDPKIGGG